MASSRAVVVTHSLSVLERPPQPLLALLERVYVVLQVVPFTVILVLLYTTPLFCTDRTACMQATSRECQRFAQVAGSAGCWYVYVGAAWPDCAAVSAEPLQGNEPACAQLEYAGNVLLGNSDCSSKSCCVTAAQDWHAICCLLHGMRPCGSHVGARKPGL